MLLNNDMFPTTFSHQSPPSRTSQDLSEALKEATQEVHEQAENTQFMKSFQRGEVLLREFKVHGSWQGWGDWGRDC